MATIGTAVTLSDFQNRLGPDDKITSQIIEHIVQKDAVLEDMMWVEGNLLTGHKTTERTGYPEAVFRKLNRGVPTTKSTTRQVCCVG